MTKIQRRDLEVNSNISFSRHNTKLWQKSTRVRDLLVRLIWAVINNFIVIKIYNKYKTSQDKVSTPTCATAAWEEASQWGLCPWWPLMRPRTRTWCPDPVSRGQSAITSSGDTWGGPQWSGAGQWWPQGGPPAPRQAPPVTKVNYDDYQWWAAIKYHGGGHFLNFHALMCI